MIMFVYGFQEDQFLAYLYSVCQYLAVEVQSLLAQKGSRFVLKVALEPQVDPLALNLEVTSHLVPKEPV